MARVSFMSTKANSRPMKLGQKKKQQPKLPGVIETQSTATDSNTDLEDAISSLSVSIWALEEGGEELVEIRSQLNEPETLQQGRDSHTSQNRKEDEEAPAASLLPDSSMIETTKK